MPPGGQAADAACGVSGRSQYVVPEDGGWDALWPRVRRDLAVTAGWAGARVPAPGPVDEPVAVPVVVLVLVERVWPLSSAPMILNRPIESSRRNDSGAPSRGRPSPPDEISPSSGAEAGAAGGR